MPRLLTFCYPTYGVLNELHLNSRGDGVVLAPDEFHRILAANGWRADVVTLGPMSDIPLFRSGLRLMALKDVMLAEYDAYWHMFRDPTQLEVLAIFDGLNLDYGGKPVINHIDRLRHHVKHRYSPILASEGLGPEIAVIGGDRTGWCTDEGCRISPDQQFIESCAYNNNRGDYPDRKDEMIVTRYVDNAIDGVRRTVRFGYAFGGGFRGFSYYSRRLAFKSGGAERIEPFEVSDALRPRISAVLTKIGIDVCHVDAVPDGDDLRIVDINPYPTSNGKTLSVITQDLVEQMNRRFGVKTSG